MDKIKLIVVASLLLLVSVQAQSAIYEYSYAGNTLFPDVDVSGTGWAEYLPGYNGIMRIDENALDAGTLVNSTITFKAFSCGGLSDPSCFDSPFGKLHGNSEVDGLLAFDIFYFPATAGAVFSFTTDYDRNIVSWDGSFLDGPPDGAVNTIWGDIFGFNGSPEFNWISYEADAGTWSSPSVVPIPAAIWLFGA